MPVAEGQLERMQILKLLQLVRKEDTEQVEKLINNGIPNLINLSGRFLCCCKTALCYPTVKHISAHVLRWYNKI